MSESRVNVSRIVKTRVVPAIDKSDFLGLSNDSCERMALFLFAMALGVEKGIAPDKPPSISFVRTESIKPDWQNLMYSALLASFRDVESEVRQISEDANVMSYASRFADTGFSEIEHLMEDDSDKVLEELTACATEKYRRLAKDYSELSLPTIG